MSQATDNAATLIAQIERKAPEYLDLLTATTDDEFEKAFDALLGMAVAHLESNKKNYKMLEEVGLTGVLAAHLTIPGLSVTQETNSNGHVDITIDADHCVPPRRKLGEAKIYNGPGYHIAGLKQLLDRYTTGREGRGLLIEYYRQKDIAGLVAKVRTQMDADKPCDQHGNTAAHPHIPKWSFLSTHKLTSGDNHEVGHIGCNLFTD